MLILESEREEFDKILSKNGLDPGDFLLSWQQDPRKGKGTQAVIGWVTITRTSTGGERTYTARYHTEWVADFTRDLDRGLFD